MRKDIYGQRKSVRVLPNQHVTLSLLYLQQGTWYSKQVQDERWLQKPVVF